MQSVYKLYAATENNLHFTAFKYKNSLFSDNLNQ